MDAQLPEDFLGLQSRALYQEKGMETDFDSLFLSALPLLLSTAAEA